MKAKTITRSYQLKVCSAKQAYNGLSINFDRVHSIMDATYKLYNRGASFFFSFWKSVIAATSIPNEPIKISEDKKEKEIHPSLLAFSFWFTLEPNNKQRNIVPICDLEKTFMS